MCCNTVKYPTPQQTNQRKRRKEGRKESIQLTRTIRSSRPETASRSSQTNPLPTLFFLLLLLSLSLPLFLTTVCIYYLLYFEGIYDLPLSRSTNINIIIRCRYFVLRFRRYGDRSEILRSQRRGRRTAMQSVRRVERCTEPQEDCCF